MYTILIPGVYVLAGIVAYAMVQHLAIAVSSPRSRMHWLFSAMCLLYMLADFFFAAGLHASSDAQLIANLKSYTSFALLFLALIPWFVLEFANHPDRRLALGLSLLYAGLVAANLFSPYGVQYDRLDGMSELVLPWGEVVTHGHGHNGVWAYATVAVIMTTFAVAIHRLAVVYRESRQRSNLWMLLAVCLFLVSVIEGILVRLSKIDAVEIGPLGFGVMVVVMSIVLIRDTQHKLRISEEKLRGLYEVAPLGIVLTDVNGYLIEFNKAFQRIVGCSPEILKSKSRCGLTPGRDDAEGIRQLESLERNGIYGPYEKTFARQDGALIPVRLNGVLITGHDGKKYIWSLVEDITDSKRDKESLRRESEKSLALLRNASDGIHILDQTGYVIEASDSFCEMLGYGRDEVIGMHVSQWDDRFTGPELTQKLQERLASSERSQFETRHRCKDGSVIDVEVSSHVLLLDDRPVFFYSSRDITKRKQAEDALHDSERQFRTLFEQAPIAISLSRDGITLDVNRAFLYLYGFQDVEEVRGTSVLGRIAPACRQDVADRISKRMRGIEVTTSYETTSLLKDGSEIPVLISATRVEMRDGPLSLAYVVDFRERKASEEQIRHLAYYDQLTQLPNRQLLADRLRHALATSARTGRHGALLVIDLDNFKSVNDGLGHAAGDAMLQQVAGRLTTAVRNGDTVARIGGDEFVVVLEGLSELEPDSAVQTEAVCDTIIEVLGQPYFLAARELHGACSIGVTLFKGNQHAMEELLKQGDIAMYQAKNGGRNSWRFFDPQMQEIVNLRLELESELHKALEEWQFELHYQIQQDSGHVPIGAEALIRWTHPERGLVSPGRFIPLAEETGLILPIGRLVFETACAQLKCWQKDSKTRDLVLAVNVSSKQFHQRDFGDQVRSIILEYGVDPRRLKLELTESLLLENIEGTITTMNMLKKLGIQFSLDDFGTGYSSLQYLKRLPLDQLKIDQSFIRDIVSDGNDRVIVRTVIAMAHSLGLDVIAEGVETEDQLEILMESGCRHFQGYLFGRPMPASEFEESLLMA